MLFVSKSGGEDLRNSIGCKFWVYVIGQSSRRGGVQKVSEHAPPGSRSFNFTTVRVHTTAYTFSFPPNQPSPTPKTQLKSKTPNSARIIPYDWARGREGVRMCLCAQIPDIECIMETCVALFPVSGAVPTYSVSKTGSKHCIDL